MFLCNYVRVCLKMCVYVCVCASTGRSLILLLLLFTSDLKEIQREPQTRIRRDGQRDAPSYYNTQVGHTAM